MRATIIYEGMVELAKSVRKEKNYLDKKYLQTFRTQFRYPGEVLEQMEQYGYTSTEDLISAMAAVMEILENGWEEGMYNSTQMEKFLTRAKAEHSLFLTYQISRYEKDPTELLKETEKVSLLELFQFFWEVNSSVDLLGMDRFIPMPLLDQMLRQKDLDKIVNYEVLKFPEFYRTVEQECATFVRRIGKTELKVYPWKDFVLAFGSAYETSMNKTQEKYLLHLGYSTFDLLSLQVGIWSDGTGRSLFYRNSKIKWSKLFRTWFQAYFQQEKDYSSCILNACRHFILPRKIDGHELEIPFLLDMQQKNTAWYHTDLFLYFFLHDKDVSGWDQYQTGHQISLGTDADWIRTAVQSRPEFQREEILVRLCKLLISDMIHAGTFAETQYEEIFKSTVKDFLLSHPSAFLREEWDQLIGQKYLSLESMYETSTSWTKNYVRNLDTKEKRDFLQSFCESRNWIFKNEDIHFLGQIFAKNWLVGIAFYERDLPIPKMPCEDLQTMIGLGCELFTRLPHLCKLTYFIAGCITNPIIRAVLGDTICESWYQLLLKRNFSEIADVQKAYLPKEVYEELEQERKEIERKEEEKAQKQRVETMKQELRQQLQEADHPFSVLLEKFPSFYYSGNAEKFQAILAVIQENYPDGAVLTHKGLRHFYAFFQECYFNDLIDKNTFLRLLTIFKK